MACIGISGCSRDLIICLKSMLADAGGSRTALKLADSNTLFDAVFIGNPPPQRKDIFTSKILVAPDCLDVSELPPSLAESVISYGLRRKNTITASSLIGNRLAISLQRRIPTIYNTSVEEQEFIITTTHGERSDEILGVAATLLVAGIPPEKIAAFTFDI